MKANCDEVTLKVVVVMAFILQENGKRHKGESRNSFLRVNPFSSRSYAPGDSEGPITYAPVVFLH